MFSAWEEAHLVSRGRDLLSNWPANVRTMGRGQRRCLPLERLGHETHLYRTLLFLLSPLLSYMDKEPTRTSNDTAVPGGKEP